MVFMGSRRLLALAGLAVWRIVAVAGVVLLVLVPPMPHYAPTHLQNPPRSCDHRLSSVARRIIHQAWMPVVTNFLGGSLRLPLQCPIHPWRDQQGPAELSKLHYRVNLWTCATCGKSFSGEPELDQHIASRHPNLADPGDFSVCLADFCDILRCSAQRNSVRRRPWPVRPPPGSNSHQVARAPSRELVALLEGTDESLDVLEGLGEGDLCENQRCPSSGNPRPRRGGQAGNNNSVDCGLGECATNPRPRCDPVKMQQLQDRCEELVDGCVSPLALLLSDQELFNLRTQLGEKVCWYLTCERYWSQPEGRRMPNMLALVLVLLTAAAVFASLTYYTVWVAF